VVFGEQKETLGGQQLDQTAAPMGGIMANFGASKKQM
jgi:hypothetical protein